MAVTMETAEQALKIVYHGLLSQRLNTEVDPLYNMIKSTSENISGKEVRKAAPFGLNGGVGAGTETGPLPESAGQNFIQFVSGTKNMYGTIAISDKSILASGNSAGAFAQLLETEINGLMDASKFNLSRAMHGNGTGLLATCGVANATLVIPVDTVKFLMEGVMIDLYDKNAGAYIASGQKRRIKAVDRAGKKIVLDGSATVTTTANVEIYVQGSRNLEITGLEQIFDNDGTLYGVDRTVHYWMNPYMEAINGTISDVKIQKAIDEVNELTGSNIDYIAVSSGVRRAYYAYLESTKRNVNTMDMKGGFKAISYNGIPLVSNRFKKDGTMQLLDTKQFMFHQLCDWRWMEGTKGSILNQIAGTPLWSATLVKYAEMICDHPGAQAQLTAIEEQ